MPEPGCANRRLTPSLLSTVFARSFVESRSSVGRSAMGASSFVRPPLAILLTNAVQPVAHPLDVLRWRPGCCRPAPQSAAGR